MFLFPQYKNQSDYKIAQRWYSKERLLKVIYLHLKKLLLEVSQSNVIAERFYSRFDFSTVGMRKNYYKDGSHALLKEKKLTTK